MEAIEAIRKSRLDLVFLQGGQLPFVHVMDIDWIEAAGGGVLRLLARR